MVTNKTDIIDKLMGFKSGADDYLTKPFEPLELLVRVKAQLRALHQHELENIMNTKDLILDASQYIAFRDNKKIQLSKTEFELLKYLIQNQGTVLTREKILSTIWGFNKSDNILDVYIKHLRGKIDKEFSKKLIKTIRGIGFTIEE